MARIAGINIPLNKRAEIGLTYIYGVGRPTANEILKNTGIAPGRKTSTRAASLPSRRLSKPAPAAPGATVPCWPWQPNRRPTCKTFRG